MEPERYLTGVRNTHPYMAAKTFDKETILDLTVNIIPLGIILFFVVLFLVITPWESDPFILAIHMGLLLIPLVSLAALTYVSGKAIANSEKTATVFYQGQATVTGSEPKGEHEAGTWEGEEAEQPSAVDDGPDSDASALSAGDAETADASTADSETTDTSDDATADEGPTDDTASDEGSTDETPDAAAGDGGTAEDGPEAGATGADEADVEDDETTGRDA